MYFRQDPDKFSFIFVLIISVCFGLVYRLIFIQINFGPVTNLQHNKLDQITGNFVHLLYIVFKNQSVSFFKGVYSSYLIKHNLFCTIKPCVCEELIAKQSQVSLKNVSTQELQDVFLFKQIRFISQQNQKELMNMILDLGCSIKLTENI